MKARYDYDLLQVLDVAIVLLTRFMQFEFYLEIHIFDVKGIPKTPLLQMDTAADISFISTTKVDELGLMTKVDFLDKGDHMETVGGGFQPRRSIKLRWKLLLSPKSHKVKLFMVDDSPYEIVFGKEYSKELRLVRVFWGAIAVAVKHSKLGRSNLLCFYVYAK